MKVVSVIPARGGSKGIPLKNIVELGGKPLISYTIEASKQSNVDETWVSTDSMKIGTIAGAFGAKIVLRPDDISTDTSQSEEALLHAARDGDFDVMVFIQPFEWEIDNRPMRQDKPETYIENGAFYITKRKNLLESKLRYSGKIGVVEMPLSRSFQIDTKEDLELIEKLI